MESSIAGNSWSSNSGRRLFLALTLPGVEGAAVLDKAHHLSAMYEAFPGSQLAKTAPGELASGETRRESLTERARIVLR